MDLEAGFVRNVVTIWGEQGRQWLDRLPATVEGVTRRWGLTVVRTYSMSMHWVARVDGDRVLKLGVPTEHLAASATALRAFDGDGSVRLLDADLDAGALLMECVDPGTPVASLVPDRDDEATGIIADIGLRLHRPPVPGLAHLTVEAAEFARYLRRFPGDGPLPRRLVEKASRLFDDLCASSPGDTVLHGDLHHDNVLLGRDGAVSIDPHGKVGDPGFDCGAMLYNPDPDNRDPGLVRLVPARIERIADAWRMPVERVRAWGFVMGVLSEVWNTNDADAGNTNGGTVGSRALDVALSLDSLVDGG